MHWTTKMMRRNVPYVLCEMPCCGETFALPTAVLKYDRELRIVPAICDDGRSCRRLADGIEGEFAAARCSPFS
jgi:hypothetical protein